MIEVDFSTKKEAEEFAVNRRKGFRVAMQDKYLQFAVNKEQRKKYLKGAIKSVKVRRIKLRHWKKPIYRVEGM